VAFTSDGRWNKIATQISIVKAIKGSKDSDHSLVCKKKRFSQQNSSLGWRPGPGELGQKGENTPPLWRHPQKIPNPKNIFNQNWKTSRICRGFE